MFWKPLSDVTPKFRRVAADRKFVVFKSAKHTRILRCVSETVLMKTIDSLIDFFDRLATPRMTDAQIETVEKNLLNLAIVGDGEAARHYADLSLSHMRWERTRSAEHRHDFIHQVHDAKAWLTRPIPSKATTI